MRIHSVRHVPHEGLGHIGAWARQRGHRVVETMPFEGRPLPDPGSADWHVVLGGPMNVDEVDEHAWLAEEKRWLRRVLDAEVPLLAICLGSQLVAEALGGAVGPAEHPEIGWSSLEPTAAGKGGLLEPFFAPGVEVMQWHYQTFTIPSGAVHLARTEVCENQAFAWGERVCALQFHPEMTREEVARVVERDGPLPEGPGVGSAERLLEPERFERMAAATRTFLDRLSDAWSG